MTKKAIIKGTRVDTKNIEDNHLDTIEKTFILKHHIDVSENRSTSEEHTINLDDDDLIALQFTDNTEWIGRPEDVQEIYNRNDLGQRSLSSDDFVFNATVTSNETQRGLISSVLIKALNVFRPKTKKSDVKTGIKDLARNYDKKIQPAPGLYHVNSSLQTTAQVKIDELNPDEKYLLLIHGTMSTAHGAFQGMQQNIWEDVLNTYAGRVIALEHYTLSESPLQNALDFLNNCPNTCNFDILSHSRGGLVADILAKCDNRNEVVGFYKTEYEIIESEKSLSKLMQEISAIASKKQIRFDKVVRVAAPASGTTILSRRVDHFFNLILNAVSLAFGVANPMYDVVKGFLMELLSQKEDPEVLPGLNSMMPESLFQKMMNSGTTTVSSDLYSISGDAEVGGFDLNSLKVILSNLFYREANDFVIDTRRMNHGVRYINGSYRYLSQGRNMNHFNYFSNIDSSAVILKAFKSKKDVPVKDFIHHDLLSKESRGVILDKYSLGGIQFKVKDISKDVVILIPGIMGSALESNGKAQWVNMREINKGGISKNLRINSQNVNPSGVIEDFYGKFGVYFKKKYDVISLEFDWRKSLTEAADLLSNTLDYIKDKAPYRNVHIVAHSMGGLVVRQLMMDSPQEWASFKENSQNKFVMLGTPWLGSHLIMEVLTGHSKRVKQLAALDFRNNRAELLEIFWKYPGVFELLPLEMDAKSPFWKPTFWTDIGKKASNVDNMPDANKYKRELKHFQNYRDKVQTFLTKIEEESSKDSFSNVYYICGKDEQTVFDYKFKNRLFSSKKKLVYLGTSEGDGSVTWNTGIPKLLRNTDRLFYTHTTHGSLANKEYIFKGIDDILTTGSTNGFQLKPKSRSGEIISEVHEFPEPSSDAEMAIQGIFGTGKKESKEEAASFNVRVTYGDLKVASYPVMTGHFFLDLILSAEKALDGYLNNRLTQRMHIGHYPGKIGESEVYFNLNTQPKGAIICGLGSVESLTPYLLSETVKLATLKYAMFMRDNYTLPKAKKYAHGISFILMGIGYGKLPVDDSVKGIILGVAKANKYIASAGEGMQLIDDVEIINYYESIASQAYFSLSNLVGADKRVVFNLEKGISKRSGAKKKRLFEDTTHNWWYTLQISHLIDMIDEKPFVSGIKYYSSNREARVEQEVVQLKIAEIDHLIARLAKNSSWDTRLSKALFEMLLPNAFKNSFRNQNSVVLKLDKVVANVPWEMLHDTKASEIPAAVSSGLIRQLITDNRRRTNFVGLNNKRVLVIGDPIYNDPGLPSLPAAKAEAIWVANKLNGAKYEVNTLINANSDDILLELYNEPSKILHFSGHGLYDLENDQVGIAIGDGLTIDPSRIKQMGYVPEFVFINCCFSGTLDAEDDVYSNDRNKLAANIGTQLIEMGVKAIVVTGWAVNDAAAKLFAEVFYENMLDGQTFGKSVQLARMACFQLYPQNNTWGAYQCYGNQFYKFSNSRSKKNKDAEYIIPGQVYSDLDNLVVAIHDKSKNQKEILDRLNLYMEKVHRSNLLDATMLEKEAIIYNELGLLDVAYKKYKELFSFDKGNYTIEALEHYCEVQYHQVLKNINTISNNSKVVSTKEQENQHLKIEAIITEYIDEISKLSLAGKNPSRLNIVADAYKHTAKFLSAKESRQYLIKALRLFIDAYNAANDRKSGQDLNALSNALFVALAIDGFNTKKLTNKVKDINGLNAQSNLLPQLKEHIKRLDKLDASRIDISTQLGRTELMFVILLIDYKKNIPTTGEKIKELYREIFNLMNSQRLLKAEDRQIDFLLDYSSNAKVNEELQSIQEVLRRLM